MLSVSSTCETGLSMEAVPAGTGMPDWLVEGLLEGRRLMVIHPTEEARKQAIISIQHRLGGGIVDTTHHLTMERFLHILHLDLRLPALLEDDGVLFEMCHEALSKAATEFRLPLLQSNPTHRWSRTRSHRLLSLHRAVIGLLRPWDWEDDPGARECDKILKELEEKTGSTHPSRISKAVLDAIKQAQSAPFTLSEVQGVVILDHAPGMSEVDLAILLETSRLKAVHQLVNPGSHRLGFHGEYIEDIHPIRANEELPEWIPTHEVWAPSLIDWSMREDRTIHHILVERNSHVPDAVANLLRSCSEDVLVVHGDSKNLKSRLSTHLNDLGIEIRPESTPVSSTPGVARIISLLEVSRGEEAWSLESLRDIVDQVGLPLLWPILSMEHPTEIDWTPRVHPEVMAEVARGFHLLGGRGSLRRWLGTLGEASPRPGINPERRARELEECQWWLASLARWMSPVLPEEDRVVIQDQIVGCSSGENLPLPDVPSDVMAWYDSLMEQIDWETLASRDMIATTTIPGIQLLTEAIQTHLSRTNVELEADEFLEIISSLADGARIPARRGGDQGLRILSPENALGVNAEVLILCGIDSESWSMKTPSVPWLDEADRMKLGIIRPDEPLRRGRHHLRHLLNSASTVVIIDSTMEDGREFSAPLDEWFSTLTRQGLTDGLETPPPFLEATSWHPDTRDRAWVWQTTGFGNRLVHRITSMNDTGDNFRTHRSGDLSRDYRQRAGLATLEGRTPSGEILDISNLNPAGERELLEDQYSRRATGDDIPSGDVFPYAESEFLMRGNSLKLLPNNTRKAEGRNAPQWPHLGFMGEKYLSLGIDPRPITPPHIGASGIDGRTGRGENTLPMPEAWSQGRIQAWLECPRRAWFDRHLYAGSKEMMREDLDGRSRGDLIHQVEQALLEAHGLENEVISENGIPLHLGPIAEIEDAWNTVLETLAIEATWMRRGDGIAAHRCRDLIGVPPAIWLAWLEDRDILPVQGRLGRMLNADRELVDAAPIAVEWSVGGGPRDSIEIDIPPAPESPDEPTGSFRLRGRIDRVDEVLVDDQYLDPTADTIVPLDSDFNSDFKVKRFVIIRDIKSVEGSGDDGKPTRHLQGLFEGVQLALYARAWEIANPGDRVVGVGVTQVGSSTAHYLETDPDFAEMLSDLELGERSTVTHAQYRRPGESATPASNPFRAWMRQRLSTSLRAITGAEEGRIHPEPSSKCSFCPISESCPSAEGGSF